MGHITPFSRLNRFRGRLPVLLVALAVSGLLFQNCGRFATAPITAAEFWMPSDLAESGLPASQSLQQKGNPFACLAEGEPAEAPLRRLSRQEYLNTIQAVLGPSLDLAAIKPALDSLPLDQKVHVFDTNDLSISNGHVQGYFDVSRAIAEFVTSDAARLQTLVNDACFAADAPDKACVSRFIGRFGLKALRRPLTAQEVETFYQLYLVGAAESKSLGAFGLLMAFTNAPDFLYHVETRGGALGGREDYLQLSNYEVANRLSYLAYGSIPDDRLFAAAAAGKLTTPQGLADEVKRLFNDPVARERIKNHVRHFYTQWLHLDVPELNVPASFAEGIRVDGKLKQAIQDEAFKFVDHVLLWESKGGYQHLLKSTTAFIEDAELAKIYGVSPSNPGVAKQLDPQTHAGILTRAAFLVTGRDTTSPIHRGALIKRQFLCDNLGPPPVFPDDPDALTPPLPDPLLSTRQRYERKTEQSRCMVCHSMINPFGFALEGFDGLGRFRATEKIFDEKGGLVRQHDIDSKVHVSVDSAGPMNIDDAVGLSHALADSPKANGCMVQQWVRFTSGRPVANKDACMMRYMYDSMVMQSQGSLGAVMTMTMHPHFSRRRVGQ